MYFSMHSFCILSIVLFVCNLVSAFPFHGLAARQGTDGAAPGSTITSIPQTRSSASMPVRTSGGSATISASSGQTKDGPSPTTSKKAPNAIDPRKPPGSVVITEPITTSGSQYYKIGQPVTFGWNYTNLLITPTALNVEAYCSKNGATYTIANNMSLATPSVVWDTNSYNGQENLPPLAVEIYTLYIYDAAKPYTAMPTAGLLAPFNGLKFGMYTPQPYTPLGDYKCATCELSAAAGAFDIVALRMMLLVSCITSLSFLWFVSGI